MRHRKELTGLSVLLVLPVQPVHSLQQLPLLAAAGVVDEVPGQDLLELADGEVFDGLLGVQVRQRRSDPPLGRRADLKAVTNTHTLTPGLIRFQTLCDASTGSFSPPGCFPFAPGSEGTL